MIQQKLAVLGLGLAFIAAPAWADWKVSGQIQNITPQTITLNSMGYGTLHIQHLPYTQVKIKEYSPYGKQKFYTSVASLQTGDFAKEIKIIPDANGNYYAKKIEVVRKMF